MLAEEKYQEGMEFLYGSKDREVNVRKALKCFIESATGGHDEAEFRLGMLYAFVGGHGDGSFVPLCKQIPINCLPTMNGDEVRRGEEAPEEPNNQNLG